MEPRSSTSNTKGFVKFIQLTPSKVQIVGRIEGLTPDSQHAFHIHDLGDLSDGCTSLASHFNPFGESHGGPHDCHRHLGDLGNLSTDENGIA